MCYFDQGFGPGTSFEYNGAVHVINLGLYLPREMCFWHQDNKLKP